jgi:hypothetical protein
MARSLLTRLAGLVRAPYTEPPVHFHSGPDSTPAVCYDPHCRSPHLDVG